MKEGRGEVGAGGWCGEVDVQQVGGRSTAVRAFAKYPLKFLLPARVRHRRWETGRQFSFVPVTHRNEMLIGLTRLPFLYFSEFF